MLTSMSHNMDFSGGTAGLAEVYFYFFYFTPVCPEAQEGPST